MQASDVFKESTGTVFGALFIFVDLLGLLLVLLLWEWVLLLRPLLLLLMHGLCHSFMSGEYKMCVL
jgi:hypothetical protein